MHREHTRAALDEYQHRLLLLACMSLPDAHCEEERLQWNGQWYDPNWQQAEADDIRFLQANLGLGKELVTAALDALEAGASAELVLRYEAASHGQYSDLIELLGQSGELVVERLVLTTPLQESEHLLLTGITDSGQPLEERTCDRLLLVKGEQLQRSASMRHQARLDEQLEALRARCLQQAEARSQDYFEEETEKLERWAEDRRIGLDIRIRQLDAEIKEARKAVRQLETLQEKMVAKKALKKLERERDDLMLRYHEEKKRIEAEEDQLLERIEQNLEISVRHERLFSLRWRLEGAT
jgi:hypothetical protein